MARISRHELKHDEFVSGFDAAYEFFLQYQKAIVIVAVVVVLAGACAWAGFAWNRHRNQAAADMLSAGLDTLHQPLMSSTTPAGTAAFASVETRAQAAAQQFQAVVQQYGSTDAGHMARYYLGLAQMDANSPDAEKTLQTAAADSDATVSALAKHALANYYLQHNQNDKAVALLQQLANQNSLLLPHAVVWMELANLERNSNPADAASYYHRLQAEYPNTQTAQQASQMLATLHLPEAPAPQVSGPGR